MGATHGSHECPASSSLSTHPSRVHVIRGPDLPMHDTTHGLLQRLVDYFGPSNVFVVTSNCDMLHERAGTPAENVLEIHGSLGRVQCSELCCGTLFPVDEAFLQRLRDEPDWVPRCPMCNGACLRPNVVRLWPSTHPAS